MTAESKPASVQQAIAPKATRNYRAWVFSGYLVAATLGFAVLFVLAQSTLYFPLDLILTQALQTLSSPIFFAVMWAVSAIGYMAEASIMVAIIVVALYLGGLRWEAVMAAVAAASALGLVEIVKVIVQRPRPPHDLVRVVRELTTFSFPSGHVTLYVVFFGFLFFLAYTLLKRSAMRTFALIVFGALIILVGPSRIYLGGHWPSDVLGAYLLGSLLLTAIVYIYRWGKPRFFVHQPAAPETTAHDHHLK